MQYDEPERDWELISAYLSGSMTAFDQLYEQYRLPLFSYLHRLVGNPGEVDDLFQQTWTKALEALPRYRHEQKFPSWLFRIAHNAAMDRFRRHTEHTELDASIEETLADPQPGTLEQLTGYELKQELAVAMTRLSPEQQEVILLRQQQISFKDIAIIQNSNLNTVLGRMHYAVKHLRRQLAHWQER